MEINYRMYTCQHHSKIVSEFQSSVYNFHACSALFSMTSEIIICDNYLVRNFIVTYLNQGHIVKNSFDGNFGYTFDELKTCSFYMGTFMCHCGSLDDYFFTCYIPML